MTQLALDLTLPPRLGREDFLRAEANAAALDHLEAWPGWPDRTCLLCGPQGAGKSHLAAIWAARSKAVFLTADDLYDEAWPDRVGHAVVLDDADRMGLPEPTLFHLLNMVRERQGFLLLTASMPPDRWGLRTADLLSRLRLAPLFALGAPDDALRRAVLVKLFADRQLLVDESVIAFLVLRLGRSLGEARSAVEALDAAALAMGRRVTRPMAAKLLGGFALDDDQA